MNDKINPNLAGSEALVSVPGIGQKLAERIMQARPFTSIEDMQRVKGIGASNLSQWLDSLTLEENQSAPSMTAGEDQQAPAAEPLPVLAVSEVQPEILSDLQHSIPPYEPPANAQPGPDIMGNPTEPFPQESHPDPEQDAFTREQTLLIAGGGSLLAFILAIILILGILAGLNHGRLRFASPSEVNALSATVDSLTSRLTTQESDLQALRTRVDGLETLDGRVSAAEENINSLNDALGSLSSQVETMQADVSVLQEEVSDLQSNVSLFSDFFENLRDILNQFFPAQQGGGNE